MSVSIINPGVSGITVETDPTALKLTGGAISGDLTVAQKVGIGGVVPVGATNKLAVHNGNIVFTSGFGVAFGDGTSLASTSPLALKAGTTFTGKVNFSTVSGVAGLNIGIGGTDAANTTAGDMWIASGGASLNFRDGTGAWRQLVNTSGSAGITTTAATHVLNLTQNGTGAGLIVTNHSTSTLPAVRITNNGSGQSLVVEDSTNPDATSFVVGSTGVVRICSNPSDTDPTFAQLHVTRPSGLGGYVAYFSGPSDAGTLWVQNNAPSQNALLVSGKAVFTSGIITNTSSPVIEFPSAVTSTTGTYDKEVSINVSGVSYKIPCRQV